MDIVDELLSREHRQPINPKAVYRTRDVSLFEDAAAEIIRLRDALALALESFDYGC